MLSELTKEWFRCRLNPPPENSPMFWEEEAHTITISSKTIRN